MLDIMRKHAASLPIKLALGAIIIVFIFFFGYSSYQKGGRGGRMGGEGETAVNVNGAPISTSEYNFFLDRNFERIKSNFKDQEVPDFARKLAQSQTTEQLVEREVVLQQADELGVVIPDVELADVIRKSQGEKDFDSVAYRHQFLPYFKNKFNMDYEQFVRQDLRIRTLEGMFRGIGGNAPELEEINDSWTFEVVSIDPAGLTENKSEKDAATLAKILVGANPKEWGKILKSVKIEPKKVGPIKVTERRMIFGSDGNFDTYKKVFSLTKEESVLKEPIELAGKIYVVRLVDRETKTEKSPPPAYAGFLQAWLSKLLAKAKVENYVEK